jgi:hypothetical protein
MTAVSFSAETKEEDGAAAAGAAEGGAGAGDFIGIAIVSVLMREKDRKLMRRPRLLSSPCSLISAECALDDWAAAILQREIGEMWEYYINSEEGSAMFEKTGITPLTAPYEFWDSFPWGGRVHRHISLQDGLPSYRITRPDDSEGAADGDMTMETLYITTLEGADPDTIATTQTESFSVFRLDVREGGSPLGMPTLMSMVATEAEAISQVHTQAAQCLSAEYGLSETTPHHIAAPVIVLNGGVGAWGEVGLVTASAMQVEGIDTPSDDGVVGDSGLVVRITPPAEARGLARIACVEFYYTACAPYIGDAMAERTPAIQEYEDAYKTVQRTPGQVGGEMPLMDALRRASSSASDD